MVVLDDTWESYRVLWSSKTRTHDSPFSRRNSRFNFIFLLCFPWTVSKNVFIAVQPERYSTNTAKLLWNIRLAFGSLRRRHGTDVRLTWIWRSLSLGLSNIFVVLRFPVLRCNPFITKCLPTRNNRRPVFFRSILPQIARFVRVGWRKQHDFCPIVVDDRMDAVSYVDYRTSRISVGRSGTTTRWRYTASTLSTLVVSMKRSSKFPDVAQCLDGRRVALNFDF